MHVQVATDEHKDTDWILRLLENIFRPIVRLLYQNAIGYPIVQAAIKRLYVDIAYEEAIKKSPFSNPTLSGIALNTGITPKDVKSELESLTDSSNSEAPEHSWLPSPNIEGRVLECWAEEAPFIDDEGKPLDLLIFGKGLTFERLIKRVCGNIGPAEIRDRLYKAGCLEIVRGESALDPKKVRLIDRYYTVHKNRIDLLAKATTALRHVVQTLSVNLDPSIPLENRFVQQERWTKRLRPSDLQEFRERMLDWVREKVSESEGVIDPFEKDPFSTTEHIHAGCGFYYFEETPRQRNQFQYAI